MPETLLHIDCETLQEDARRTLEEALSEAVTADMPLTLELVFLSEEDIRALNARERGVDAVTDVLSFPAADLRPGEPVVPALHPDCVEPSYEEDGETVPAHFYLGSVAVCEQRAREQAEEYGHSYEREVGYLIVHGFLHCLGYDHMQEGEQRAMRQREEEIMQKLKLGREA